MSVFDLFDADNCDDEEDDSSSGCFACVGFVLALVVSGCFTIREARYWINGRTVSATVTHVHKPTPADDSDGVYEIRYSFVDSSSKGVREESDSVPASSSPPPREVSVRYLPGRPSYSRIVGNESTLAVWIFAIVCLSIVALVTYLYIDAKRAFAPHHPKGLATRKRRGRRWFPWLRSYVPWLSR
jgi:hypothetical protein